MVKNPVFIVIFSVHLYSFTAPGPCTENGKSPQWVLSWFPARRSWLHAICWLIFSTNRCTTLCFSLPFPVCESGGIWSIFLFHLKAVVLFFPFLNQSGIIFISRCLCACSCMCCVVYYCRANNPNINIFALMGMWEKVTVDLGISI